MIETARAMPAEPADVEIVPLEHAHVPRLVETVRANDPTIPHLLEQDLASWFERGRPPGEEYFTALHGGQPVGMTGFRPDPWGVRDIYWLVWLYIDPAFKRRGIATRLFGHAQARLCKIGCRKVYLDVGNADKHQAAIAFHKRDGFLLEGFLKDYWEDGDDFFIFGKRLDR